MLVSVAYASPLQALGSSRLSKEYQGRQRVDHKLERCLLALATIESSKWQNAGKSLSYTAVACATNNKSLSTFGPDKPKKGLYLGVGRSCQRLLQCCAQASFVHRLLQRLEAPVGLAAQPMHCAQGGAHGRGTRGFRHIDGGIQNVGQDLQKRPSHSPH